MTTRYVCPECGSELVVYVKIKGAWCSKSTKSGATHRTATMVPASRLKAVAQ